VCGQHVSRIAATSGDGVIAHLAAHGVTKGADFHRFVVEHLVPALRRE